MRKFLSNLTVVLLCLAAYGCSGSSGVALVVDEKDAPTDAEGKRVIEVRASGETKRITITGPDWEATSSASWLKVSQDEETKQLVIKADAHYAKARAAEVLVKSIDGEVSLMLTIKQKKGSMPAKALTFKKDSEQPDLKEEKEGTVILPASADTHKFGVQLYDQNRFTWRVDVGDVDWISSEQSEPQSKQYDLYLTLKANPEIGADLYGNYTPGEPRSAVIDIVCEYIQDGKVENEFRYKLTVKQRPIYNEDPYTDDVTDWTEE